MRSAPTCFCLQDSGLNTVEASLALVFREDERDYAIAAHRLKSLDVETKDRRSGHIIARRGTMWSGSGARHRRLKDRQLAQSSSLNDDG